MAAVAPPPHTLDEKKTPEITVINRVASIPLIASPLEYIHNAFSTNAYTKAPYAQAQGLSVSAWKATEPIQVRLAPYITSADEYANKGLDAVENRFPYPFKAQPEDVASYVRERQTQAYDAANKRVVAPTLSIAKGVDQSFAPIVDFYAVQVGKLNSEGKPTPPVSEPAEYQYKRAYRLSLDLKDNIYYLSSENVKQLQAHNTLVQRATETANSITELASSSITTAHARIHALSDSMLAELQKLQQNTANLPQSFQKSFPDLNATITSLRDIVTSKDLTLNEKAGKVTAEVRESVNPILEAVQKRVREIVGTAQTKTEEVKEDASAKVDEVKK